MPAYVPPCRRTGAGAFESPTVEFPRDTLPPALPHIAIKNRSVPVVDELHPCLKMYKGRCWNSDRGCYNANFPRNACLTMITSDNGRCHRSNCTFDHDLQTIFRCPLCREQSYTAPAFNLQHFQAAVVRVRNHHCHVLAGWLKFDGEFQDFRPLSGTDILLRTHRLLETASSDRFPPTIDQLLRDIVGLVGTDLRTSLRTRRADESLLKLAALVKSLALAGEEPAESTAAPPSPLASLSLSVVDDEPCGLAQELQSEFTNTFEREETLDLFRGDTDDESIVYYHRTPSTVQDEV